MKFNSKTLQNSFEQVKPILENLNSMEQAVAEDIQELEAFLKTIPFNQSYRFHLQWAHTPPHQEELLVWDHRKQKIIYVKNVYGTSCSINDKGYYHQVNYNDKELLIEIPLAESAFELRKQVWQEEKLASFLSFLSQTLKAQKSKPLGIE